ncbi:MAG: GAF domain-containing protein [Deltaproteobacteria bacterium]|nr:GAF domain-containing protein [Deltaproteobacteria bacterium]
MAKQQGQAFLLIIGLVAVAGLLTLILVFSRFEPAGGTDPVVVFLLVTYPFLLGGLIYYYLQEKKIAATLQEEYYFKWFLQSFAKVCQSETDLQTIREELVNTLLRLIRPSLVMLYELDEETNRIKNLPDAAAQGYTFGEGIPGWVMQNQNIVILPEISKEPYLQTDPWAKALDLRSYAAVPVTTPEKSIGIIAMYSHEANFFQDSNLLIAQLAAQLYGLSLTNLTSK